MDRNKKRHILLIELMGWIWGVRVKKERRRSGAAGSIVMLLMKWGRLVGGMPKGEPGGQCGTGKARGAHGCVECDA